MSLLLAYDETGTHIAGKDICRICATIEAWAIIQAVPYDDAIERTARNERYPTHAPRQ
jgi:hypothetical protein